MTQWFIEKAYAFDVALKIPGGKSTYTSFQEYFHDLFNFFINLAAILTILILTFAAYKYVTSGGDEAKIKDAKDWIYGAVIGFVVLVFIKFLMPILGIQ